MQNLTATIPHQLTRAEAKRRIQDGIAELRRQHGGLLHDLRETWKGDRMDFAVAALGMTVTGHLEIDDRAVHVEVALPWLLSKLAESVKRQIQQQGRDLLGGPSTK
jgi:putative polyhydroxyalkanoate system protein